MGFKGSHFHDYEFVCICSIQGFSRQKYLHISSPDVVEVVEFRLPLCYRMNPPTSPSSYCCQRFCCGLLTVRLYASSSSSSSSSTAPPPSGLTLFYLLFLCSSLFSFAFPLLFFFLHAARWAQTRALLRNAGLALASTNKRTGAAPAGGYRNIH